MPADITSEQRDTIRELAVKAFKCLGCGGVSRIDFMMDTKTGNIWLNEINTIPGFTKYSMFPLLCKEAGIEYDKLLERIIELGYERYYAKNNG